MARNNGNDKSLESWIWDAACSIRGAADAPKYKDFILPLVFAKRLCDVFDDELDARGLNCPMPLVKARKQIGTLDPGQVLKVVSTDRGSINDFKGWAKVAANIELLAQETATEDGDDIYLHFVKRVN